MSRIPSTPVLLLVVGAVSISAGLLRPWERGWGGNAASPGAGDGPGAVQGATAGAAGSRAPDDPRRSPVALAEDQGEIEIVVALSNARDGGPAAGARLTLWRRAYGEGSAYRSGRRLTPTPIVAGADGRARIAAPRGVPLRISARTADGGPARAIDLGPFGAEHRTPVAAEVDLDPAPLPLEVTALGADGAPLPGARVHLVAGDTPRWSEFPGSAALASRTDGAGHCTLDGAVRAARWVAVEATGHAPAVVPVATLERSTSHTFRLGPEARAEVFVRSEGDGGDPVADARVELRFELGGLAAARSDAEPTGSRGRARIRHLPAGVDLVPVVTLADGRVERYGAITLAPTGTRRTTEGSWSRVELLVP